MRFSKLQRVVVALVVAGFVIGASAIPAQASSSDCPSSYTCLWNGTNWSGTPAFKHTMPSTFGACINVDPLNGANNNAESVYNRNGFQVSFYDGANGSGYMFSLAANAGISNINVFPSPGGWGNRISSICHE